MVISHQILFGELPHRLAKWREPGMSMVNIFVNKSIRSIIHFSLSIYIGRGPSIWDTYVRIPGNVADGSTPDDACKSYQYYQQDVNLLKNMGVI